MGVLGIHLTPRGARAVLVGSDGEVLNAAAIHTADLRDALGSAAREAAGGRPYELVGLAADRAEAIDVAGLARIVGDARIEKASLVSAGGSAVAAEEWVGAARGARHAIFLWIGEDVLAGIMLDGKPLAGATGSLDPRPGCR